MKVLGSILTYLPDRLWKDYYAIICFYSSTKAVFDLGTMALLFPVLVFPVLLSRPAWSKFSDSELELLCAQELCCPDEEDCFVSDLSLMVFFVSVTQLKGWR